MLNTQATLKQVRPFSRPSSWKTAMQKPVSQIEIKINNWLECPSKRKVIEIGCGAGLHPIQWCKSNPQGAMLAFERTKIKSQALLQRQDSHELHNLFAVNGNACHWLPRWLQPESVDDYFFLYPNPYPKEKQSNKRWHRSSFFHFILQSLKPGGQIHIATNEAFYFEECVFYLEEFWQTGTIKKRCLRQDDIAEPRSHFEKKYLARGQQCFEIISRKND